MNIIDKSISFLAPQTALKRQVARKKLKILNSGYSEHGASRRKKSLLGWIFKSRSPDEDIVENADTLRQRSRDLYMGAPIATGAIKTMRTNIVGAGLKLNTQIDAEFLGMSEEEAEVWEKNVEREFSLWANNKNCDASRMNNFYQMQSLAFLSMLLSGDSFALLPVIPRKGAIYDLRVYLIEADRVCDPPNVNKREKNILGGVEVGNYGEPKAYWISRYHPGSATKIKNKWDRIPAFGRKTGRPNVIHLIEQERPEQRRGVPVLAPVIESLKQLGRYTDAELMAAVVSGMYTIFIKSDDPENGFNDVISADDQVDEEDQYSYELGNGAIVSLGENESIQEANPGRPNTAFDGFVTAVCRQVGTALEVPYELLIKHFTSSYSASRAALLEAWKMFKMRREWMAQNFCQPIYEEWLAEAVAKGRIDAPGFFLDESIRQAYSKAEWNGPAQGQIDPLKEAKAAEWRVENGFSTRTKETAELTGGSWDKNHRIRVREEKLRREGGLAGNE